MRRGAAIRAPTLGRSKWPSARTSYNRASVIGSGAVAIDRVKGLSFALTVQGSGAGEIDDVAVDQMNISLEGTASAALVPGKAGKLTALVRGVSALDAAALATPSADIDADGAGHDRCRSHRHRARSTGGGRRPCA